jgi:hypothetical protein
LVHVRGSEPAQAAHETQLASRDVTTTDAVGGEPFGISGDGRYVVFSTRAATILPPGQDTNGQYDVFRYDRVTHTNLRVSEALGGGTPNGESYTASFARNGRYVAFESFASNLVVGDGNFQRTSSSAISGRHERARASPTAVGIPTDVRVRRIPTTAAALRSDRGEEPPLPGGQADSDQTSSSATAASPTACPSYLHTHDEAHRPNAGHARTEQFTPSAATGSGWLSSIRRHVGREPRHRRRRGGERQLPDGRAGDGSTFIGGIRSTAGSSCSATARKTCSRRGKTPTVKTSSYATASSASPTA